MRFGALGVAVCAGCFRPSPPAGAPCPDGTCPNGQTCVAGICQSEGTPGTDASGDATPQLVPSNGISPTLLEGATAELMFDRLSIDSDDGSIRSASIVVREAGEGLISGINFVHFDGMGVFSAQRFAVPAGKSWDIHGDNTIVLFAATTIDVAGTLDAGASGQSGALGGHGGGTSASNPGCRGHAGGAYDLGFGDGGGGGGGVATGGHGAPASMGTPVDGGADTCASPSTRPLQGGHGGGAGGYDSTNSVLRGGPGGGGGGAIALVAMGSISVSGVVGSPGAGGLSNATGDGGGGGGAGGAVFLESLMISVTGAITANGGGGGAASGGDSGGRGHLDDANRASGGAFNTAKGGLGGSANGPATDGDAFTDAATSRGCGGGGAAGTIELRGITTSIDPMAVASPAPMMTTADVR
jgi:hypothetical protein